MRSLRSFTFIFVFLLTLGLIGVDQAQGVEPNPGLAGMGQARGVEQSPAFTPNLSWNIETIDNNGDVGQFSSMALDPTTGLPHISYYNATTGDLSHAYMTNNPINTPCLVVGWECETWPTAGIDGTFTAMAIRDNGNIGILYLNEPQDKIYLRGDQGNGIPLSNNNIDSVGTSYNIVHNLQYDRNGVPHAIFIRGSATNDSIRYTKYVGSGGNCENSQWQCEIITSNLIAGPIDTSLGITYFGSPRLAIGNWEGLRYAIRAASSTDCSPFWTCNKIEGGFVVTAVSLYQPSCQIICNGPVEIAYYDYTNQRLKFAVSVESGGNCGVGDQAGKWQCDIIETVGLDYNIDVSLFVYNGQPYIAYTDHDDRANTTLKIAYPSQNGNCGPLLNGIGTWQCDTVDNGFRGGFPIYHPVGQYPTIKINSAGIIYISYHDSLADDLLLAVAQLDVPPPPTASHQSFIPAVFR